MRIRRRLGTAGSLVLAAHPVAAVAMATGLSAAAALSGRGTAEVVLVAATVLCGQATVGWIDDVADRHRDAAVGREDRPVARGWVEPGTVTFSTACVVLLLVPLSVAHGTIAGAAYLLSVAALWVYHLFLKKSVLSWVPWTVSFGLLPAFLSYGGIGGGVQGDPPTQAMTAVAAALGLGVHVLTALPDLVHDHSNGLRHLPLRVALRTGAPRLLWLTLAYVVLVGVGLVVTGFTAGLTQPAA